MFNIQMITPSDFLHSNAELNGEPVRLNDFNVGSLNFGSPALNSTKAAIM